MNLIYVYPCWYDKVFIVTRNSVRSHERIEFIIDMTDALIQSKTITIPQGDATLSIQYRETGTGFPLIYLHGWGLDSASFIPYIESLNDSGRHIAIDLPGFGASDRPQDAWGTEEYADFVIEFLQRLGIESCLVVGHSFGGRIAIRMARRGGNLLRGMILIASAGLKRKVPWRKRLRIKSIQTLARFARRILPGTTGEAVKQRLYNTIASRDYKQAGEMRAIFVRVVSEDLTPLLPDIKIPALLIWGAEDQETPPSLGQCMHKLLPNSVYIELPGFDHHSILDRGRHQAGYQIRKFIEPFVRD